MEPLHFSHFHHVSLVQWTNHLLPANFNPHLVYGDVYLYRDTHLHPSKFFSLLYVSIYTYNEHVPKQYSYSLIIILLIV